MTWVDPFGNACENYYALATLKAPILSAFQLHCFNDTQVSQRVPIHILPHIGDAYGIVENENSFHPSSSGVLLAAAGVNTEKSQSSKMLSNMGHLRNLQHVVQRFQNLAIDSTEFGCLKAIVLFKPGG